MPITEGFSCPHHLPRLTQNKGASPPLSIQHFRRCNQFVLQHLHPCGLVIDKLVNNTIDHAECPDRTLDLPNYVIAFRLRLLNVNIS